MSAAKDAAERVNSAHKRLAEPAINPSVSETKCSQPGCDAVKNPLIPDYSPVQLMTDQALGWYSGDDGEFCPQHIAELVAMGNRQRYTYYQADGTIGATS
jgi:hypothetical protein